MCSERCDVQAGVMVYNTFSVMLVVRLGVMVLVVRLGVMYRQV